MEKSNRIRFLPEDEISLDLLKKKQRTGIRWKALLAFSLLAVAGAIVALFAVELGSPSHACKETAVPICIVLCFAMVLAIGQVIVPRTKKAQKQYCSVFKQLHGKNALKSAFTVLDYVPNGGIRPPAAVLDTARLFEGRRMISQNDYVSATYKHISFERSDMQIKDDIGRRSARFHHCMFPVFHGQCLCVEVNSVCKSVFLVVQRGFRCAAGWHAIANRDLLSLAIDPDDKSFGKRFQVYARVEQDAHSVLTPAFMGWIEKLADRSNGKLMLCFAGRKLYVFIRSKTDYFEPGSIFKRIDEEKATRKIREEIEVITQFIDELSLDNNLFVQER